ncbi:MAG: helix-turn-helix domain-containing protein [Candidatus Limnocylindria bacterium]
MLRIPAAARLLDISRSHCYSLALAGVLPAVRLGNRVRIPPQLLDRHRGHTARLRSGVPTEPPHAATTSLSSHAPAVPVANRGSCNG